MGIKLVFKNADFSENGIAPEYMEIPVSADWEGWLCNYNGGTTAQQNASWSTAFFAIPEGATAVYLSGYVDSEDRFGVSLVSDYNTTNHTYTNVAINLEASSASALAREELDLSSYPTAKYVMWCRIGSTGVPTVEVLE